MTNFRPSLHVIIRLRYVLSWPKLGLGLKFHEAGTFGGLGKCAESLSDFQWIYNTGPYGDPPPLKMKNSNIRLRHVLSWSKLVLEQKFHEAGTFAGFGKHAQTHTRFVFYKYR